MNIISVADLRRNLSAVLDAVEAGERIIVTRYGKPVAVVGSAQAPAEAPGAGSAASAAEVLVNEGRSTYGVTADSPAQTPGVAVRHDQWNDRLFASVGVRRVLSLFVLQPERVFYQREAAREAEVTLRSAQLALDRLVRLGLIDARRSGNRMHYAAIRSPAFDALRQWAIPEVSLVPLLREALEPLGEAIEMAFVYGSTAAGQDTATSDIDLMIVGEVDTYALYEALGGIHQRLKRETNVTQYDVAEFSEKLATGAHFITSVMRGPVLWILGEDRMGRA